MSSGHTPGPWFRNIPPASKYRTIFAGRNTHVAVLSTLGLAGLELEANASLIAAAPELLEALEAVVAISDRKHDAWDRAKAAIAKAKGEI